MSSLNRIHCTLILSLFILTDVFADAATNFVLNKTNFFSNDPIILQLGAISIDSSDEIVPASNVFIIPAGLTLDGSTFFPGLDPSGVPNVIFGLSGGGFFDETIGFTKPAGSIGAGTWDIVEDTNQNNIFDLGDSVLRNAFTVNLSTNVPPIMSSAQISNIKLRAASSRGQLETAKAFLDGSRFAAGAVEAGFENGVDAAIEYARDELVSQFLPCRSVAECALGYLQGLLPETPVEWGFRVIDDLVEDMVGHYAGIAADPPDPDFQQVTTLTARIPVFAGGNDPFDAPSAVLFRAQQDEAATAAAFLHAMERYQGADAVGNGDWGLLHARQLREFALLHAENLAASNLAYSAFINALNADSRDLDARVASYQGFVTALQTSGYSPEQMQGLANLGFTAEQQDTLLADISTLDLSGWSKAGLINSFADLHTNNSSYITELNELALFLDGIIATLVADPLVADNFPVVDAGGPYNANENAALQLDASGSNPGSGATIITSYEWDLDGDGAFDDATGVSPNIAVTSKQSGVIGLKITNDEGIMNIGYGSIAVIDSNPAPTLISFNTPDIQPTVLVSNGQLFSVNADDNGAINVEWFLDGVSVANGNSFNYTPGIDGVGVHILVARIGDGTASGGTVTQTWTVSVQEPDGDGDGYTPIGGDCNDANGAVNPAMIEVIDNGLDDDCNPATEDANQSPVADFITFPFSGADGEPIEFLNRASDANGDIVSATWDFGDTSTSTEENPTHQFPAVGIFNVQLTVTDSQGNSDSTTQAVEVLGARKISIVSDPDVGLQDSQGRFGDLAVLGGYDVSEDGLWVVFASAATNLIANDLNGRRLDVFVKNTQTGEVVLISKNSDGTQAAVPPGGDQIFQMIEHLDMSADGRFVLFSSTAKNLIGVDADNDGACDTCDQPILYALFLHDRDNDGNGIFDEPGNVVTERIEGVGSRGVAYISDNGRFIAFQANNRDIEYIGSENESLPGGNVSTNYVFLHDRVNDTTRLISRRINGDPGSGHIPAEGSLGRTSKNPFSADGSQLIFQPGDLNEYVGEDTDNDGQCDVGCANTMLGQSNLLVYNARTDTVSQVNINRLGQPGLGNAEALRSLDMSADGRFIAFDSGDDNLIVDEQGEVQQITDRRHLYVHDRDSDENGIFDEPDGIDIELVSVRFDGDVDGSSYNTGGSISDDGRLVFFIGGTASLLGPPFTGTATSTVFRDRAAGRTVLAFRNIFGNQPITNIGIRSIRMSGNSRFLMMQSLGSDLIGVDVNDNNRCRETDGDLDCKTNTLNDVYLVDRDADNDGLVGDEDSCANTLPNQQVGSDGCSLGFEVSIQATAQLPAVAIGDDALFDIVVSNTGAAELVDLTITAPQLSDCDNFIDTLTVSEVSEYSCALTNLSGPFSHTVTVNGATTAGEPAFASDTASVGVATPSIAVTHTPDPKEIDEGLDYVLAVSVTNTGDVNLQNVTVDANPIDTCDQALGELAPDESVSYSCLVENALNDFTSNVAVTGTPTTGNTVGASDSLDVIVIPADDEIMPPPAPINIVVRAKPGKANVVWTHNGASSYNVYRSVGGNAFALHSNTSSTYSVFVDNGLTNGTEYCYFVRAVNEQDVESEDSAAVCATPTSRRGRRRR